MLISISRRRKADIALIGLAVMGQNLILNMDSKGFVVCAYNRTVDKVSSVMMIATISLSAIVSETQSRRFFFF
jgi:6-phosphogluconate dehydrogenase